MRRVTVVRERNRTELDESSVDKTDLKILAMMRTDARISLTSMAKKLHLSKSAVKYRLDRLIELGVIKSFFALVDSAVYGFKLSVVFDLSLAPQAIEHVASKLSAYPEVLRVYELTNGPQLHVHALFADNRLLEEFIRNKLYSIPDINIIKTDMIMKRYKTDLTLTL